MLLNQLVTINQAALVANAVSFELMDDPEKNLRLCQGFVFNYDSDPKKLKTSTVGVLYALRQSFYSSSEPNIHLMVQDYGKGKSHFALAIANFFHKPNGSSEVDGILQQIEYSTSSNNYILENLKLYKKQGKNLVICLSGDKPIDLKKHFLQALRKALESEGITDSIGQQICKAPRQYLENLNTQQRQAAEAYLKEKENPEGDLDTIMELLREDNYQVISRVKEISRQLTGTGLPLDFDVDIDVEEILSDVITRLCTGENRPFQGILILFDELYNYLQLWANDPVRAGSTTLQGITKVCERFKGKIALISFSQRRPKSVSFSKNLEDYNRLASRLELLPTTYEPAASLELVLNNLLVQQDKTTTWQQFYPKWRDTLTALNTEIYQNRTADYYKSRNWEAPKFLTQITVGCFPLHPLTSYLLCNLDFTQGRTAIQFVQTDVTEFIQEQPVEKNNSLNFIYPVTLVDAFAENFKASDYSAYSAYIHAHDSIAASADIEELTVLKALFLYYASVSVGKLTKLNSERHEKLLGLLTGMSEAKLKAILDKLSKEREVIYYNSADNAYRFYSGGFGIQDLRKRIEEEVGNKRPGIERVREFCQSNLQLFGASLNVTPTQFIDQNKLNSSDWLFKCEVYTPASLRKALNNQQSQSDEIGTVAYVVVETSEELASLKSEMSQLLAPPANDLTSIKRKIAVAVASQPAEEIARLLLMLEYAKSKSVQEFGAALTQLQDQLEQQIKNKTKELFNSCTYYCYILDKVPVGDRTNPSRVISILLQDLYPLVAPQEKNDKIALKSTKGGGIIAHTCKLLLKGDSSQVFPDQSYTNLIESVFVRSWRMLKLDSGSKYSVQIPIQTNVKAAWDKISDLTALGDKSEKNIDIAKIWETLSKPPYGYNEYTFTILFAGWLAYHRSEVFIKGGFGIPQKSSEQVTILTKTVKDWASTNIFDKPKDFIQKWVLNKSKPQLIRRQPITCPEVPNSVNYDQAQQFIQEINDYLSNAPDPSKVNEITDIKQKLSNGVNGINQRLTPVSQAESLFGVVNNAVDIEQLIRICTELQDKIPVIHERNLSISPTTQQETKREEVLQVANEKIGAIIEDKIQQVQSLRTEADCTDYQADINKLISLIPSANYLPSRFIQELQNSLTSANNKLLEIAEQAKIDSCLQQIQIFYNSISSLTTQSEYIDAQTQIENLVTTIPAAREKDIYKNIIKDLEAKQEVLIQKIDDWENQFSQSMSRPLAMQLSSSINKEINRFTNEESKQRLNDLLRRVENIILQRETEEQESEDIHDIIADAERKLQDTKNTKKISDAFTAYRDLNHLKLPPIIKIAAFKNKPKELENLKSQGYDAILQRLTQIIEKCEQPINQDSDYEQLQSSLQKSKEFVTTCDDFQRLITDLQEAEETLQSKYEEFKKQQQDQQKVHSIRQYTASKANTIQLGEDSITNINSLKNEFYYPDKYISEVEKLIQEFINKVTTFKNKLRSLQERLSTVTNSKEIDGIKQEYAQLDFVFKDSTEYSIYQQLQAEIDSLAEDLELIRYWESLYQQSNSIASCDRALASIDNEQASLHNLDRFRQQIEQLQINLRQRKQGYIGQLEELYGKLSNIKTQKEAQKMQGELNNKSAYYRESQEEERYQSICSELNLVSSLLQISATQKLDTLQACQAEKERLLKWQEESGEITATVQTHFDSMIAQLEQTQQQIENQQRDAARKWLEGLEVQNRSLESIEPVKKLDNANQLLKKVKQQRHQYQPVLQAEQQQILKQIINNCVEIQNQDKESKILTLFQELPREQRESLLKRLSEYLSGTTEEF
jgi:hypothetical protein